MSSDLGKELEYLYISRIELLCENRKLENCLTHAGNEPVSYDKHHLSLGYAQMIGDLIGQTYASELTEIGLSLK
ncbi:MAG: hypothetical protein HKN36_13855 [Hellea sp.]|nr:hypothetical protein [Hellea sp.]